ncbi:MAG TPA: hypothetical protein VN428_20875 [Bryobacteraceae bacterium]|nr:hypothetical protein [Bryobacteraceae bacterium]
MKALLTCLFAMSLCAIAADTKKPNLTGDWKLNVEKSNAPGIPDDLLFKIRHNDPEFLATQEIGGETTEFKMGTDGKEYKNSFGPGEMVTVMKWAGDVLLSDSTIQTPGGQVKFADRLMLDGKLLKIQRTITGPDGDRTLILVLEK